MLWHVSMLRPKLNVNRFSTRTDPNVSSGFTYLRTQPAGSLVGVAAYQNLNPDVIHRAGIKHQAADAMSCIPSDGTNTNSIDIEISIVVIDTTLNLEDGVILQDLHCHAIAPVVKHNDDLLEGSGNSLTLKKTLWQLDDGSPLSTIRCPSIERESQAHS